MLNGLIVQKDLEIKALKDDARQTQEKFDKEREDLLAKKNKELSDEKDASRKIEEKYNKEHQEHQKTKAEFETRLETLRTENGQRISEARRSLLNAFESLKIEETLGDEKEKTEN